MFESHLHLKLLPDEGLERSTGHVVKDSHKVVVDGFLETQLVRCRIQDGWSVLSCCEDMLLDFGLQELLEREILNVVDDSHTHELRRVVYPDKEGIVDLLVAAEERCVVVDGDLHEAVHAVVHDDGLRVVVFDEVSVEPSCVWLSIGEHVPTRHRTLQVVLEKRGFLRVDPAS